MNFILAATLAFASPARAQDVSAAPETGATPQVSPASDQTQMGIGGSLGNQGLGLNGAIPETSAIPNQAIPAAQSTARPSAPMPQTRPSAPAASPVQAAGQSSPLPKAQSAQPPAGSNAQAPASASKPANQARSTLSSAAGQISSLQKSGAPAGEVMAVLKRVFEAQKEGARGPGGAASPQIAGRLFQARDRIAYLLSQADAADPEQAPAFYQDAIAKTRDAAAPGAKILSARAAGNIISAILSGAVKRAQSDLPRLAARAYRAAAGLSPSGRKTLERILGVGSGGENDWTQPSRPGALDRWQALLTRAGTPIRNLGDLKADLKRVEGEARPGVKIAVPRGEFAFDGREFSAKLRPVPIAPNFVSRITAPSSFFAVMPSLAPAISPDKASESSAFRVAAFLQSREGYAAQLRYWMGYLLAGVRYAVFLAERRLSGSAIPVSAPPFETQAIVSSLESHYRSAMDGLQAAGESPSVAVINRALSQASYVARDYERVSGDASADFIVSDFAGRISAEETAEHLSPDSAAPRSLVGLIEPLEGDTLSHWMTRFEEIADARGAASQPRASGARFSGAGNRGMSFPGLVINAGSRLPVTAAITFDAKKAARGGMIFAAISPVTLKDARAVRMSAAILSFPGYFGAGAQALAQEHGIAVMSLPEAKLLHEGDVVTASFLRKTLRLYPAPEQKEELDLGQAARAYDGLRDARGFIRWAQGRMAKLDPQSRKKFAARVVGEMAERTAAGEMPPKDFSALQNALLPFSVNGS
ncbi:MAG: hypothetical protein ACYCPQ_04090 [Elusimicrobiota bacterium]